MSYYYNYFAGYKLDGKVYPWGPYNARGELFPIVSRSASFASDLHDSFSPIKEEEISDELRKRFECEDWHGNKSVQVKVLPAKELPSGTFIKSGYFLISDVEAYEKDEDGYFDGFYDMLSPQIYAAKMQKELQFGKNQPKKDIEGNEYTEPNASDYMFYAFPNYDSREYEAFLIRNVIEMLNPYNMPEGVEYVVLETEG